MIRLRGRSNMAVIQLEDDTGSIKASWFGRGFLANSFKEGKEVIKGSVAVIITGVGLNRSQEAGTWIYHHLSPHHVVNLGTTGSISGEGNMGGWVIPRGVASEEGEVIEGSYPSIIYGKDDALHVIYSYHFRDRRMETIKYARINEAWIKEGDK